MRSTKVLSFLAASIAMLSHSPVAYASLIPTVIETPMGKRCIPPGSCRIKELSPSGNSNSDEVTSLVDILISALTSFKSTLSSSTLSNSTSIPVDLATPDQPDPTIDPTDGTTTPIEIDILAGALL